MYLDTNQAKPAAEALAQLPFEDLIQDVDCTQVTAAQICGTRPRAGATGNCCLGVRRYAGAARC